MHLFVTLLIVTLLLPILKANALVWDLPLESRTPAPVRNVLFIIADDLNCVLGAYGGPAKTPHLDRLAANGTLFTQAYCQSPLCGPSRVSMLTGRPPDVSGVTVLPSPAKPISPNFRERLPDTVTLPQLFKLHGAFSARVGKLFHYGVPEQIGTDGQDDAPSWSQTVNPRGLDREIHPQIHTLSPGKFGGTLSWLAAEGTDAEHTDGIVAAESVRFLERFASKQERFFLGVGFFRPHTPFVAPKKWFDLYALDSIPSIASLSNDDRARLPKTAYASASVENDRMSAEQRTQIIQAYFASVSFLDAQVGIVLTALERLGLATNTVIVFTSDHGYHLGDHGLWQKQSLFERSARVPLIVAAPGISAGQRSDAPVGLIDLYPTLTELAGLPAPTYLAGRSLTPQLRDPSTSVNDAVFSQIRDGYSVRKARWRYTEWSHGTQGRTLHDLTADPQESHNLAESAENSDVVQELHRLLEHYRTASRKP